MFKELEIPSTGVALTFFVLVLVTIGLIIFFKKKFRGYKADALIEQNKSVATKTLSERTKFPEVDVFRISSSFFNYGMTAAVALALVAMSWTTYEKKIIVDLGDLVLEEEMEVEIPRTAEPPPPPPPPPPPV
ncbi:MAG: energy transducer TonB, partial [Saprospiraceae bacterium]